jgi:cardiolipin synthase
MLHAKTMVVDRELAVVGSANVDNRSFRLNFEIVAAIYGEVAADRLAREFEADLRRSREVLPRHLARRSPQRILARSVHGCSAPCSDPRLPHKVEKGLDFRY